MILIVDDDADITYLLKKALTEEGYEVMTAGDGVEAYEHLKAFGSTCMLLDIDMPRINGIELLLLLQAEDIHVPTIVMAGFDDFKDKEMKEFSNVVKFMHKPFGVAEMLAAVNEQVAS